MPTKTSSSTDNIQFKTFRQHELENGVRKLLDVLQMLYFSPSSPENTRKHWEAIKFGDQLLERSKEPGSENQVSAGTK